MFEGIFGTYRATPQSELNLVQVFYGTPTFGYQTLLRHVQIEHVQCVVDRFDLANFNEPNFDVLRGCHEYAMTMILGLTQYLQHKQFHN